jgi:acetyl esterase/lipase
MRHVPARDIPLPNGVTSAARALISAPYSPLWNAYGSTKEGWRKIVAGSVAAAEPLLADLRQSLEVEVETVTLGGVQCFVLTPTTVPEAHRDQVVLSLHGGGYVYGPGLSGTTEATLLAAFAGYRVISVNYRMPPDAPYPAALDDAESAYRALIADVDPSRLAVFGSSAGGGLAFALMLRLKAVGVALPRVLAANSPWADLTGSGDSHRTNEWLDNVIVSYAGYLGRAAQLYAGDHDLAEPEVSPVFGDLTGLPPTILLSGTRDLLLSDAVRLQRKLRQAAVRADLQVFEGLSHSQFLFDPTGPETRELFGEVASFFQVHLND